MGSCLSKQSSKQANKASSAVASPEPKRRASEAAAAQQLENKDFYLQLPSDQTSKETVFAGKSAIHQQVVVTQAPDLVKPKLAAEVKDKTSTDLPAERKTKISGEFPLSHNTSKPSSPRKSVLQNFPASPASKKLLHRTTDEKEDCKFPSSARRQWLSQAENLVKAPAAAEKRSTTAVKYSSSNFVDTLVSGDVPDHMKILAPEASVKAANSRTNSFSRDPSPVEPSRPKATRPSSPMKRSPSVKDPAGDGSRLSRSSSGKALSPNRHGLHQVERQEPMRARKASLSKEFSTDLQIDSFGHKRNASRDSVQEFASEHIRKPSPPKRTPVVVPSCEANRLAGKRQQAASAKAAGHDSASVRRLRRSEESLPDLDAMSSNNGNKSIRKEKSPLRRTSNGATSALNVNTKLTDRNVDLSINSDSFNLNHRDIKGKDGTGRTKRISSNRVPLREIPDNVSCNLKPASPKQVKKESSVLETRLKDEKPLQKEALKNDASKTCNVGDEGMLCLTKDFASDLKDPLELKAENLVMGGKSVLSAFKALEEYRSKYSNSNSNVASHKDDKEDTWYSRQKSNGVDKENNVHSLQGEAHINTTTEAIQQLQELPRSRSTKRSCEPFLFPDVQSLLMSDNEGVQLEEGMAVPASISKACSILRAVADLNKGTSVYPNRREAQDEIERPNLLSFQFGEGDSHRVTQS